MLDLSEFKKGLARHSCASAQRCVFVCVSSSASCWLGTGLRAPLGMHYSKALSDIHAAETCRMPAKGGLVLLAQCSTGYGFYLGLAPCELCYGTSPQHATYSCQECFDWVVCNSLPFWFGWLTAVGLLAVPNLGLWGARGY